MVARHALTTCLSCGMCTSVCPAAEHFADYDPRCIVDTALSGDEGRLVDLLKSDALWYCAQCGSCNSRCPHENDIMGLVGSLRCLAQLKGYHVESVRGRQQFAARHLWGGNLWNRAVSLYFRNGDPAEHPDFGPRYARWQAELEEQFVRVGGQPDRDGAFAGRKVTPETLEELRSCIRAGGALFLWDKIEQHAQADATRLGLDIDEYYDKVRTEG
jgi:heterodisulfide reductase subunit C